MKPLLFITAAVLAAVGAQTASAQTYVEATVSHSSAPDLEWGGSDYEMDSDVLWSLAVGRQISPNLALEAEVSLGELEYSCCNPNHVGANSLMGNVIYTFMPDARFRPYVGAGLGVMDLEYSNPGTIADTVLAGQVMVGVATSLNDRVSLFAEYRYRQAATAEDAGLEWEYRSHNVGVGARYSF